MEIVLIKILVFILYLWNKTLFCDTIYVVVILKKEYEFNKQKYVIEKDEYNVFDYEEVKDLITDYFTNYDYIFGDITYNKIRLKGFFDKDNKKVNKTNRIEDLSNYLENYCAYKCKWFLLKKLK